MINCLLIIGIILSGSLIGLGLRMLYLCSIVKLSGLNPSHPLVPHARSIIDSYGGVERFERGAKTGIELFLPIFIVCLIALIVRLYIH